MKNTRMLMLLVVTITLALGTAHAQTNEPMKVRVPFPFMVGNVEFPAGECLIEPVSVLGGMLIRSSDGSSQTIVMTSPIAQTAYVDKQKVVFHRYGGTYFLSEFWAEGFNRGRTLKASTREVQLANGRQPEHVTVLSRAG